MAHVCDAAVIGGGFYGTFIATYLVERRGFRRVTLIERENELLQRASFANQARVHSGYHYPRSFTTAYRSRINLPRFAKDFPDVVRCDFTKVYAIARTNSKVTVGQFMRFCREIGAPLAPAPADVRALFEHRLVESAFLVEEYAFDASALRRRAREDLRRNGVETILGARVESLHRDAGAIRLRASLRDGACLELAARHVFNCTYSGLNQFGGDFPATRVRLKHEIAELVLVRPPSALDGLGITVMDGSFFSIMPFPARGVYSLSHVRYTPHQPWADEPGVDPYARLDAYDKASRVDRMVRDASRYLPAVRDVRVEGSLFEVKTVLVKNEADDGRPILFQTHPELGSCHSILGAKIDNIYDVVERLDALELEIGVPAIASR